jgi:hypothetical protein
VAGVQGSKEHNDYAELASKCHSLPRPGATIDTDFGSILIIMT